MERCNFVIQPLNATKKIQFLIKNLKYFCALAFDESLLVALLRVFVFPQTFRALGLMRKISRKNLIPAFVEDGKKVFPPKFVKFQQIQHKKKLKVFCKKITCVCVCG